MNPQNELLKAESIPTQADTEPKLAWQTPCLEELPIEATAGFGGPFDDDLFDPITTLS